MAGCACGAPCVIGAANRLRAGGERPHARRSCPGHHGRFVLGGCIDATRRLAASLHNAVNIFVDTHSIVEAVDDFIDGNGSKH